MFQKGDHIVIFSFKNLSFVAHCSKLQHMFAVIVALSMAGCGGGANGGHDDAGPTYSVSATVSGLLVGKKLTLMNNDADAVVVTADGAFAFPKRIVGNGDYKVTVSENPVGQTCSVSDGVGSGIVANVADVKVICSANLFSVGVAVSGLEAGKQLVLQNNGTNATTVKADGSTQFSVKVAHGAAFAVTVQTQPAGMTCTVGQNSKGTILVSDVLDIQVVCSSNAYVISGSVSGLAAGKQVALRNNSIDQLNISSNGSFKFSQPLAHGGSMNVTVASSPAGQTCTVSNGQLASVSSNVTNVIVNCSNTSYKIGGAVAGLASGTRLVLLNNGSNSTTFNSDGSFSFSTAVAYGSPYAVTVSAQPIGQTCTVANASSASVYSDVSNVSVRCSNTTYSVGGSISGIPNGKQVTLLNNGGDPISVKANGAFTFPTRVPHGGSVNVTVQSPLSGFACVVRNGSVTSSGGLALVGDISGVRVECTSTTFTVGGSVAGLAAGESVILANNGSDLIFVDGNKAFVFNAALADGAAYSVASVVAPSGKTCAVTAAAGAIAARNVSDVAVVCAP